MKNKTRNVAASVRHRLLNYAGTIRADPNLVLLWYGIERLLYRLSLSPHGDKFVLRCIAREAVGCVQQAHRH